MNVKEALRKIGMKLEVKEIERKNWRGDIQKDIDEIKQDIKKLSSNMNELIDMLKSIYEFEDVVV